MIGKRSAPSGIKERDPGKPEGGSASEKVMFEIDEETRKEPNGKIKFITFYSISLYKKINDNNSNFNNSNSSNINSNNTNGHPILPYCDQGDEG